MIEIVQVEAKKCTCELCQKVWLSLATEPPMVCPGCRSKCWNGKKRRGRRPTAEIAHGD